MCVCVRLQYSRVADNEPRSARNDATQIQKKKFALGLGGRAKNVWRADVAADDVVHTHTSKIEIEN